MSRKNLIIALILPYDKCDNENEKLKKWKNDHENCHKTIVKIRIQKTKSQIVLIKVKLLQQTNVKQLAWAVLKMKLSELLFFQQMIALRKLLKMLFLSSKKALSILNIQIFVIFPFLSTFLDSEGPMTVGKFMNWLALS